MPDGTNFGGALPRTRDIADDRSPADGAAAPAAPSVPEAPAWRPERISGWLAGH